MSAHLGLAWLAHRTGRDLQRAVRLAGGPEALWSAGVPRIAALLGLDGDATRALADARQSMGAAGEDAARRCTGIASLGQSGYPSRLAEIHDPPFVLFARGPLALDVGRSRPVIAVVGTRRPTAIGLAFARRLGAELARRGAVVVSGLALGIDAAAHAGALSEGGDTIAVVGCGVDVPYPRRNRDVYEEIVRRGSVVSEYWPGTEPAPWRFPARNRIVAGLADAVVVVEAGTRSGSLITADFALEIGRPVLAVPGPAGAPVTAGCHALLRAGAALCESADDVCHELPEREWGSGSDGALATGVAAAVLAEITNEALSPDELAVRLDRPVPEVAGVLALLELDGLAIRDAGRFRGLPARA